MTPVAKTLAFALAVACCSGLGASESFEDSGRAAHQMLTHLCDDFGGRLTGSSANEGAMASLSGQLRALGLQPVEEPFAMPGWERGSDEVWMTEPVSRQLRIAALGYTQPCAPFEADVVDVGNGTAAHYPPQARGRVALLDPSSILATRDVARIAMEKGVRAVLYVDREGGGQLLARTGSFIGEALPLPIVSVTQEEGRRFQRLLARGRPLRVRLEIRSRCLSVRTRNLKVIFPGRSRDLVIVGAHFDSWDLGQGAMDNGLGVAQLFALARALRGRDLARTVELVWFNGEEQGLWGSRYDAGHLGNAPVVAMVNLDMVGTPIAVNALGDPTMVAPLERWNASRGARRLPLGVKNINWFGSDHLPYQLAGVRAVTIDGEIPRDSVRYYHDYADTIDKVPEKIVVYASAVIGDLVVDLANDPSLGAYRRPAPETEALFTVFDLQRRMKGIGYWPFKQAPVAGKGRVDSPGFPGSPGS
jgi:Iap family predicted aminopeptidase